MTEQALVEGIAAIARRIGRLDPARAVTAADHLVDDLGIDSLDLVGIYLEIQDEFGVEIAEADLPRLGRVGDLAAYVRRHVTASSAA